jgi:hypothetical protein
VVAVGPVRRPRGAVAVMVATVVPAAGATVVPAAGAAVAAGAVRQQPQVVAAGAPPGLAVVVVLVRAA